MVPYSKQEGFEEPSEITIEENVASFDVSPDGRLLAVAYNSQKSSSVNSINLIETADLKLSKIFSYGETNGHKLHLYQPTVQFSEELGESLNCIDC